MNIQLEEVDERLDSVEDDVDEWDDKITALEVANVDITDRLTIVEEIILGKFRCTVSQIFIINIVFDILSI